MTCTQEEMDEEEEGKKEQEEEKENQQEQEQKQEKEEEEEEQEEEEEKEEEEIERQGMTDSLPGRVERVFFLSSGSSRGDCVCHQSQGFTSRHFPPSPGEGRGRRGGEKGENRCQVSITLSGDDEERMGEKTMRGEKGMGGRCYI